MINLWNGDAGCIMGRKAIRHLQQAPLKFDGYADRNTWLIYVTLLCAYGLDRQTCIVQKINKNQPYLKYNLFYIL